NISPTKIRSPAAPAPGFPGPAPEPTEKSPVPPAAPADCKPPAMPPLPYGLPPAPDAARPCRRSKSRGASPFPQPSPAPASPTAPVGRNPRPTPNEIDTGRSNPSATPSGKLRVAPSLPPPTNPTSDP